MPGRGDEGTGYGAGEGGGCLTHDERSADPSEYRVGNDPLVYPAQARARLVHVIDRMAAVGYLTKAQQDAALDAPLGLSAVRGCQ